MTDLTSVDMDAVGSCWNVCCSPRPSPPTLLVQTEMMPNNLFAFKVSRLRIFNTHQCLENDSFFETGHITAIVVATELRPSSAVVHRISCDTLQYTIQRYQRDYPIGTRWSSCRWVLRIQYSFVALKNWVKEVSLTIPWTACGISRCLDVSARHDGQQFECIINKIHIQMSKQTM